MRHLPHEPINTPPVLQGPHGKAWLCDRAAGLKQMNIRPEDDATLDHWLVEAPWAHPLWHSYSIVLVHLRPMPDHRKTLIYLDDATHEIWVHTIDPEADRNSLVTTCLNYCWLEPTNFAAQFIEIRDDLARERVRNTVQEICDGKLSPDTDWISEWYKRFSDNMKKRPNARPPRIRT